MSVLDKQPLGQRRKPHLREPMYFRILLSYWYYGNVDLETKMGETFGDDKTRWPDVFADSGAFSAWTQNGSVDRGAYAEWLHQWKHLFKVYAGLDVKGDWRAGLDNQEYLEGKGLAPLPVFHGGEPWELLDDLCATYPYLALGGLAGNLPNGSDAHMRFSLRAFEIAAGRTVFHGFGVTSWRELVSFPWYSVDSSTWGNGYRYGAPPLFDERHGKLTRCLVGKPADVRKKAGILREMGFDPADFADRDRNNRFVNCAAGAMAFMRAERWLRHYWGPIHIPDGSRPQEPGPRVYLVDSAGLGRNYNFAHAADGLKLYLVISPGTGFADAGMVFEAMTQGRRRGDETGH